MTRPLTPKSFEHEDSNRPRSTTPRAYSPLTSPGDRQAPQSILRRGSQTNNTRALPRTDSPVFVGPTNRRKLEQAESRSYSPSNINDRSQPISPLQPSEFSKTPASSSFYDSFSSKPNGTHTRDLSTASSQMYSGFAYERTNSAAQSTSAPALPDSPLLNPSHPMIGNTSPTRSTFKLSDSGLPSLSAASQSIQSVVVSPDQSRFRLDSQELFSDGLSLSPFSIGPMPQSPTSDNPLLKLATFQNSSQTSLISTGSSYHSQHDAIRQASDAAFSLISPITTPDTTPEGESNLGNNLGLVATLMTDEEAMSFFGLKDEDLAAMQDKLIQVASPDLVLVPHQTSLRRRKNSIPSRVSEIQGLVGMSDFAVRRHPRIMGKTNALD